MKNLTYTLKELLAEGQFVRDFDSAKQTVRLEDHSGGGLQIYRFPRGQFDDLLMPQKNQAPVEMNKSEWAATFAEATRQLEAAEEQSRILKIQLSAQ